MKVLIKEWDGDKLNRSVEASFLYNFLISRYDNNRNKESNSLVLNINASWGLGKTFFLNHWSENLKEKGHPVIFFNAWTSDFQNDPFAAFISEIEIQLSEYLTRSKKAKEKLKMVSKVGARLLKNSIPLISAILLKQFSGLSMDMIQKMINGEELDLDLLYAKENDIQTQDQNKQIKKSSGNEDIINSFASLLSLYGKESLEKYLSQKNDIKSFQGNFLNLINYIDKKLSSNRLPIFIIIDELDRCRPTYSIELLEQIKHIFSMKGVYFILATDTEQLCHSIQAIYGNNFDSSKYLKRFFDRTYEFREPDYETFANYLFNKYRLLEFETFLYNPLEAQKCIHKNGNIAIFALAAKCFKLTLRDQEQIADQLYTICLLWPDKSTTLHSVIIIFLLMLKHQSNEEFEIFKNKNMNWQDCNQRPNRYFIELTSYL